MRRKPVTIGAKASIQKAAELFAKEGIGLLVIASSADPTRAEAVVSERDVVRAVAKGTQLGTPLDSIASRELVSVRRSDQPSKAAKLMMDRGIRHLVVENDDGTLFGVLSIRDFFREDRLLQSFIKDEGHDTHGSD